MDESVKRDRFDEIDSLNDNERQALRESKINGYLKSPARFVSQFLEAYWEDCQKLQRSSVALFPAVESIMQMVIYAWSLGCFYEILNTAAGEKVYRRGTGSINQTFYRLRLLVLIALTTGMRIAEIFALRWGDIFYREELIAVRSKLKGGKMRYVPMPPELATEISRFPAVLGEDRIFPPKRRSKGERQRVEGSFETILEMAGITDFRFHDLRHTMASWYMMNGGDLYELAKILGHSNVKMTERYAKLGKQHIASTGNTAREIWKLMQGEAGDKQQTAS